MELIDVEKFVGLPAFADNPPIVNFVIPCYNEQAVLPETAARLGKLLSALKLDAVISPQSSVYLVDDGSKDATWPMIADLAARHGDFCGIKLSRNRGHQNALLCGLMSVGGDAVISLDADLQDDPREIPRLLQFQWPSGRGRATPIPSSTMRGPSE